MGFYVLIELPHALHNQEVIIAKTSSSLKVGPFFFAILFMFLIEVNPLTVSIVKMKSWSIYEESYLFWITAPLRNILKNCFFLKNLLYIFSKKCKIFLTNYLSFSFLSLNYRALQKKNCRVQ